MIKAFIFDLDGTLVDTLLDIANSVNYSLIKHNLSTNKLEDYRNFIGNGSKVLIRKSVGENNKEQLYKDVYDVYLNHYINNVCIYSKPYKNVVDTLTKLKRNNYLLFVVTNKPSCAAIELVNKLFNNLFDGIYGVKDNLPTKPDPYMINLIKNKYNLDSNQIVYVGDSDVDMILANNASIKLKIGCSYGYQDISRLQKYNPYKVIDDFSQLLELIK